MTGVTLNAFKSKLTIIFPLKILKTYICILLTVYKLLKCKIILQNLVNNVILDENNIISILARKYSRHLQKTKKLINTDGYIPFIELPK